MYLNTDIFDVIDSLWYGVTLGGWRIAGLTVPTLVAGLPPTTKAEGGRHRSGWEQCYDLGEQY